VTPEDARAWFNIRDTGMEVIGGYLSPVTDAYKKKVRTHHTPRARAQLAHAHMHNAPVY
jgi:hypothetical protein